jgi:GntR family transcriptional regulator / MocR family aminotransferase
MPFDRFLLGQYVSMEVMGEHLGLDLHLDLEASRPARSLESALRAAVLDGRLSSATRLPAARSLAVDLGISRNTVASVYAELTAEGWLESRVGAGTWVSDHAPRVASVPTHRARTQPRSIDLRGGIPDSTVFPRREWVAAVRAAVLGAPATELGYPDPAGVPGLRAALAEYLSRTRGVAALPSTVVVGHGFGDLLILVCRALRDRGARWVAVEEYGHESHRRLIAAAGLEPIPIPVDGDGADVTVLDSVPGIKRSTATPGAVLLTPAHQFPVGVPLSPRRRRWLVDWAHRSNALILEDDYDGEFRYDRRSIGALQALSPDRVVYLGTASKAGAPSVGLAWAVPPTWILPDALEQRELSGGQPSALHQLALATFLSSHEYDRGVRRLRGHYRARRTRLEQVVADQLPGCEVTGLAAGLQCLLRLPMDADENQVEREAARRGLRLEGLGSLRAPGASNPAEPAMVIGYGAPTSGQYESALSILVDSVRTAIGSDPSPRT